MNVKREYNVSSEGPPFKRQRVTSAAMSGMNEKFLSSQIEELLETIVQSTDKWPSYLLESLFSSLEFTIENNGDICTTLNEYTVRYEERKQATLRAKEEEN